MQLQHFNVFCNEINFNQIKISHIVSIANAVILPYKIIIIWNFFSVKNKDNNP